MRAGRGRAGRAPALARACAVVMVLAGCGHGEPYGVPLAGADAPLVPSSPARLTYNLGHDQAPAWRPDGGGLLYTAERQDRPDADWCLEELPPDGGRSRRTICELAASARDSTDALVWAAVSPEGRLAYLRTSSVGGGPSNWREVVVAPFGDPARRTGVATMPFTLPGYPTFTGLAHLRWLDATTLVARAGYEAAIPPCRGCPPDTVLSGRALVIIALGPGGAVRAILPGTDYASSVAVRGPDEIVFTRCGDTRVLRMTVSSGAIEPLWDFAPEVPRDVQVAGNRLAAVVGGSVRFAWEPPLADTIQRDDGGAIALVDLSGGNVITVGAGQRVFRRLALSPDGRRLVAESPEGRSTDLYLFALP